MRWEEGHSSDHSIGEHNILFAISSKLCTQISSQVGLQRLAEDACGISLHNAAVQDLRYCLHSSLVKHGIAKRMIRSVDPVASENAVSAWVGFLGESPSQVPAPWLQPIALSA